MAIETVNIGTTPNDGTGDTARAAFTKINENFTAPENAASKMVATNAQAIAGEAGVLPDAAGVKAHVDSRASIKQSSDITVTVGSGADFTTINAALTHLSNFYPEYKNTGVTATIELQAGFVMSEQVLVRGIDFGWVTITGVDAQTTIANAALTIDFSTADYGFASSPAFGVSKGGVLPRIGQLFIFDVAGVGGNKHGVMAVGAGSSADVLANCGVVNAGTWGIFAGNGSTINAQVANASGAGTWGIFAGNGSTINAQGANASGAGSNGIVASNGSTINARDADASGAGDRGIVVDNGSTINARDANASGVGDRGIVASRGSTINAQGADASGAGSDGISAFSGSTVNAGGSTGTTNIAVNTLAANGIIFK